MLSAVARKEMIYKEKEAQEDMKIRKEKQAMAEREFEIQRQLELLAMRKRVAAAQQPASSARKFLFIVEENELVAIKRKVEVAAYNLAELEEALRVELSLAVGVNIWVAGQSAPTRSFAEVPQKGKITLCPAPAPAPAASVAAAGAGTGIAFKLLICENETVKMKCTQRVTASSMEELELALADKLDIPATFIVCPFDPDFQEFVEGVNFDDLPPKGQVELRPKPAPEAVEDDIQPEPVAAPAPAPAPAPTPAPEAVAVAVADSAALSDAVAGLEARMGAAMMDAERKMREAQDKAEEAEKRALAREEELDRKHREAEERFVARYSRSPALQPRS